MSSFTPVASAMGGALIGVSATAMLTLNGKVAGISGIFGGLVRPRSGDGAWRGLFLVGLVLGGALSSWVLPGAFGAPVASFPAVVLAGLLVGVGTQVGSGCTSGHGVCGVSRGSARSIVATATFMATAFATVFLLRHVLGGAS